MASDQELKILLRIQADVAELQSKLNPALGETKAQLVASSEAGNVLGFALGGAIGGATAELVSRLTNALADIPRKLFEGIRAGVEFQAKMQDVATNIASVLSQTQPEKFANFGAAKAAANDYIETIKAAANRVGVTYADMIETVQRSQSLLANAGITDADQAIKATLLLQQAIQSTGVASNVAARDLTSLLSGNANTEGGRALANQLHITTQELQDLIAAAIQSGNFLGFLQDRFGAFAAGIADSSQNFNADVNRMKNVITDLESEMAKPIMQPLQDGITGVIDPKNVAGLTAIARAVGFIASAAIQATQVVVKFRNELAALATVSGSIVGPALGSVNNLVNLVQGLGNRFAGPAKAIADAGKGWQETTEATGKKLTEVEQKQADILAKGNAQAKLLVDTLSGNGPAIAADRAQAAFDQYLDSARKLGPITVAELETAYKIKDATEKSTLAQLAKRDAAASARDAARAERLEHQQTEAALRAQALHLQAIKGLMSAIEADPFATVFQKAAADAALIPKQIEIIQADIASKQSQLKGGLLDPQTYIQVKSAILQDSLELIRLGNTAKTIGFGGSLKADLVSWVNQIGTTAQQVGGLIKNTLGSAISGISSGITGAIFHTQSLGQAALQMGEQFVQSLIQVGVQMIAQKTLGSLLTSLTTSEQVASGAAIAAANAPAAAATSIASFGGAAVSGASAAAAAIASIIGALSGAGGFASGGFTGGREGQIAGVVHGNEFVFSAPATRNLGPDKLSWLHDVAVRGPGYQTGGFVSLPPSAGAGRSGSSSKAPVINQALFLDLRKAQKWLQNREGDNYIINLVNSRGGGLRS